MPRIRDLEGRPTRIKDNIVADFNQALKVLGVERQVTGTPKSLFIGSIKIQAVRSYTTTRSIEFDHKVCDAIHSLLDSEGVDHKSMEASYQVMRKELEALTSNSNLMFGNVSSSDLVKYVQAAQAVVDYSNNPAVKECFTKHDALNVLFSRHYSEVIME